MTHRKRDREDFDEATKRERDEFERARAEGARKIESPRREIFTAYQLWLVCPDKRCRRAKACRGDVDICLRERWYVCITDEQRALLYKFCEFRCDGMGPDEAAAAAQADIDRHKESLARLGACAAAQPAALSPVAPAPMAQSPAAERGPRVRSLD